MANITVEYGTRYYQKGTEYDLVLEERLVGRAGNGTINYRSYVLDANVTGEKRYEVPRGASAIRETDVRLCAFGGALCE